MLLSLLTALSPALASPGLEALSAGDLARYEGDRRYASYAYRQAIESGEHAAEAMARLRMLSLTGNLGALVHGPRLDRALARSEGDWGKLAWADYHLMAPAYVGARPEQGLLLAEELLPSLPGPAAARLHLGSGDPRWTDVLEDSTELDGMGEGQLRTGRSAPPDPGTWFFSLGLMAAPRGGVGGGTRLLHPDIAFEEWRWYTSASASNNGNAALHTVLRSPGSASARASVQAWVTQLDVYQSGVLDTFWTWYGAQVGVGPQLSMKRWDFWMEGRFRSDHTGPSDQSSELGRNPQVGEWSDRSWTVPGLGLAAVMDDRTGMRGERRGAYYALMSDLAGGDYSQLALIADGRYFFEALGGALGVRAYGALELNSALKLYESMELSKPPVFVLPTAGGSVLHRGAWAGRYRAPSLVSLDLEQRWSAGQRLEPVVFVNQLWVRDDGSNPEDDGIHPGAGVGLRLLLPPEEINVVRLDFGFSDSGLGIYAGWGEVF